MMLQGLTVQYLLNDTYKVQRGDTVLFHAIAGGVGLIALQWLKAIGATVIGTVGSPEKAALAKSYGCDHVIQYRTEDFVTRVKEITNGKGVAVAYDGVGAASWQSSLDSMARRGTLVSFGNASGPVTGVALRDLATRGSLYVTRPGVYDYYADPAEAAAGAAKLWDMVLAGKVAVTVGQEYALTDAAQAHIDLEARRTTGSTLLMP